MEDDNHCKKCLYYERNNPDYPYDYCSGNEREWHCFVEITNNKSKDKFKYLTNKLNSLLEKKRQVNIEIEAVKKRIEKLKGD